MPKKKPHTTRTFGPIHFEDLEPHRFESLVRQLIYDFRDWQSIEATGAAGTDDGFDARAWESAQAASNSLESDNGADEDSHPMLGREWMVQCKREKKLGPADISEILADVPSDPPPYGYILAASATFSKRAHDLFRELLREKGVMEFYLWGKEALEDMLFQPKNDPLLFAYFGISLLTTRRKKTTEVRSTVAAKNKLIKTLGLPLHGEFHAEFLIRDIGSEHYPYEAEYGDFESHPRWVKRTAVWHDPMGLAFHFRTFHAYFDHASKEYDYSELLDLSHPPECYDGRTQWSEKSTLIEASYFGLPRSQRGTFKMYGIVPYRDILLIDSEGDAKYPIPHLYLEIDKYGGPYASTVASAHANTQPVSLNDDWKRASFFPAVLPQQAIPSQKPKEKPIDLDAGIVRALNEYKSPADTLFYPIGAAPPIQVGDVFALPAVGNQSEEKYIRITAQLDLPIDEYAQHVDNAWAVKQFASQQLGRDLVGEQLLRIVEFERAYPRQWKDDDTHPS